MSDRTLKGYLLEMKLGETPDERILAEEMIENLFEIAVNGLKDVLKYEANFGEPNSRLLVIQTLAKLGVPSVPEPEGEKK